MCVTQILTQCMHFSVFNSHEDTYRSGSTHSNSSQTLYTSSISTHDTVHGNFHCCSNVVFSFLFLVFVVFSCSVSQQQLSSIFHWSNFHHLIFSVFIQNGPSSHSRFDFKMMTFCLSYFPCDGQTGSWSSHSNEKTNLSMIFVIICRYQNLVKNLRIILYQIENSQVVTTLKSCTDYGKNNMLFLLNFA